MHERSTDALPEPAHRREAASADEAASWLGEQHHGVVVPSFDYRIDFASATATGVGRDHNEDALLCLPDLGLFSIADGMGGHAAGEVAARVSHETLKRELADPEARALIERYARDPEIEHRRAVFELLVRVMKMANDSVRTEAERERAHRGMGTTLDLVLLVRDRAFFAHVGDSRAYLVRPTATLQLTHDHAAYDSLRSSGKRTPSPHFSRGPLTNSIGHRRRVVVDTLFVDLGRGDVIVLCTDGAFDALDGEATFSRLCRSGQPAALCTQLIGTARQLGGLDDASVLAVRIGERFAQRRSDAGPRARDFTTLCSSPLLTGLQPSAVLSALAAGVEVEIAAGHEVPRAVASDRVAYIVLDGLVTLPGGRTLGAGALLMAESLLDVTVRGTLPKATERARLLRIRYDDFREVCSHNTLLAAELYMRLAHHLARTRPGQH